MKLLGHRLSYVGEKPAALALSKTLLALGIAPKALYSAQLMETEILHDEDFSGAVFAADENNWIEFWAEIDGLPKGLMLQLVVDNADEFADYAKKNHLNPQGPVEAHGEKIYYLQTPTGLPISFQSKIAK